MYNIYKIKEGYKNEYKMRIKTQDKYDNGKTDIH